MIVNKYNLIRWDNDGAPPSTCTQYAIPIMEDDVIGAYINFDDPISDDITNWRVGIWVPSAIVIFNIATLNEVDLDGTTKDIYFTYTVGVMPRWFRFVIYDTADSNAIKYWSNGFKFKTRSDNTLKIKYRNSFNQVNFEYESATTFYNQCRIDAILGEPRPVTDTVGYQTTLGLTITSKNVYLKQVALVTLMMDVDAHLGMAVAVKSDEFYLDDIRYYAKSEDAYDSGAVDQYYPRWNGRMMIYEYDYTVVATNT